MKRHRIPTEDEDAAHRLHLECTVMAATFKAYGGERRRLAAQWEYFKGNTEDDAYKYQRWVYPFPFMAAEDPNEEESVALLHTYVQQHQKATAAAATDPTVTAKLDAAVGRAKRRAEYYYGMLRELEKKAMQLGANHFVQRFSASIIAVYTSHPAEIVDVTPSTCRKTLLTVPNVTSIKWLTDTSEGYSKEKGVYTFIGDGDAKVKTRVNQTDTYRTGDDVVEIYVAQDPVVQRMVAGRYT